MKAFKMDFQDYRDVVKSKWDTEELSGGHKHANSLINLKEKIKKDILNVSTKGN